MSRIPREMFTRLLALLAVVATLAVPALAAEDVLTLLPKKSLGFAVVNRLSDVSEKLGKHARELELPIPSLLMLLQAKTGIQQGLDDQGTLMLAVVASVDAPKSSEDFKGLLALPVSDYKQFVQQFDGKVSSEIVELEMDGISMLAAEKSGYALLVSSDAGHRALLKEVLEQDAKVPAEIAVLREWIAKNDATVVVLAPGIEVFAEQGITGIEKTKDMFAQMEAGLGDQMAQTVAGMDMYIQVLRMVKTEVQIASGGLRIDASGNLLLGGRVRFTEEGQAAKIAGVLNRDNSENLLADLPGGPFAGAMGASLSPKYGELMAKWSVEMMKKNPALYGKEISEEEADKFLELSLASTKGFRGFSMMASPGEAGKPLLDGVLGIFTVDNAANYLANYKKIMDQFQKIYENSENNTIPKMEMTQVEIAGKKGLKITTDMGSVLAAQGGPPEVAQMFEKIFGEDGKMTAHLLVVEKNKVLFSYGSQATIERQVTAFENGEPSLAQEASIQKTMALLPKEADLVAHLSPRGAVAWFKNIASRFMPPGLLAGILEFPETPTLGFSAKMVSGGLETELVVPTELPKAIKEYAESMQP